MYEQNLKYVNAMLGLLIKLLKTKPSFLIVSYEI